MLKSVYFTALKNSQIHWYALNYKSILLIYDNCYMEVIWMQGMEFSPISIMDIYIHTWGIYVDIHRYIYIYTSSYILNETNNLYNWLKILLFKMNSNHVNIFFLLDLTE